MYVTKIQQVSGPKKSRENTYIYTMCVCVMQGLQRHTALLGTGRHRNLLFMWGKTPKKHAQVSTVQHRLPIVYKASVFPISMSNP